MPETPDVQMLPAPEVPAGHRCRTDDLAYTSVGDWYRDHHGPRAVHAPAGLLVRRGLHRPHGPRRPHHPARCGAREAACPRPRAPRGRPALAGLSCPRAGGHHASLVGTRELARPSGPDAASAVPAEDTCSTSPDVPSRRLGEPATRSLSGARGVVRSGAGNRMRDLRDGDSSSPSTMWLLPHLPPEVGELVPPLLLERGVRHGLRYASVREFRTGRVWSVPMVGYLGADRRPDVGIGRRGCLVGDLRLVIDRLTAHIITLAVPGPETRSAAMLALSEVRRSGAAVETCRSSRSGTRGGQQPRFTPDLPGPIGPSAHAAAPT